MYADIQDGTIDMPLELKGRREVPTKRIRM